MTTYFEDEDPLKFGTYKTTKEGPTRMSNFIARITKETTLFDGQTSTKHLRISGITANRKFDEISIPAGEYQTMSWVTKHWGADAVISPGGGCKDDLRAAIQLASKPVQETIYTHTGWTKIKNEPAFLHQSGAITKKGLDKKTLVMLPDEIRYYNLPDTPKAPKQYIDAALDLVKLATPSLTSTLLVAAFRPTLGPTDFAIHLAGRTGTFKSEILSLYQSLYGEMDARKLPGSWSSTANALEAQAYKLKNTIFVIDDYVPSGTSTQIRQLQKTADQIFRAQGNQSGRARLTDISTLQRTMSPRGMIFSTGEEIPTGHSIRGRIFIMETSPGDVDLKQLTKAQSRRNLLPSAMSLWLRWLANNTQVFDDFKKLSLATRDRFLDIGHSRTPSMIGDLYATASAMSMWIANAGIKPNDFLKTAEEAILEIARSQAQYHESQDPTQAFLSTLRAIFASGRGHAKTRTGGIPERATELGWILEESIAGTLQSYRSSGKRIAWVDWPVNEMLIDIDTQYEVIKKESKGVINISKQTMIKRLKDAGLLTRTDAVRQRNTVRVTAENATRTVITILPQKVLQETQDVE